MERVAYRRAVTRRSGSALPSLGRNGEGWVVLQLALIVLVFLLGLLGPRWPPAWRGSLLVVGIGIGLVGIAMAAAGIRHLGASLTPLPRPRAGASLRQNAIYGVVRHPIYGGISLAGLGWSLALSPLACAASLPLATLLELKSRREEAWLSERYANYAAYRARVRWRLVPWVH
jgi:protein-S-isoprenylcysteine O-methyltransferase Ste14